MSNWWEGIRAWINPQAKTPPRYYLVEIEKGVPVNDRSDIASIATLRDHPGMVALINRMRLQRAFLTSRLATARHKDIRDVDSIQHGLLWLGYLESEINTAIGRLKEKQAPVVAVDEVAREFERVRSAIESVGTTSSE